MKTWIWLAAVVVLAPVAASAQTELFNEGNQRYQDGDFAAAVESYSAVLQGGFESPELYYNLGNAQFRLGDVAQAILAYERAARLDPGNEDVRENLRLANARLADRIEPLPRFWLLSAFDWWLELFPRSVLTILAATSYVLFCVFAVGLILGRPRGWRYLTRQGAIALGVTTLLLGSTMLMREMGVGQPEEGIILAGEVSVLSAPSTQGGLAVFTLHSGTKVRIDQRAGEWAEVVLADGKVGWLPIEVLAVI